MTCPEQFYESLLLYYPVLFWYHVSLQRRTLMMKHLIFSLRR